MIPIDGRSYRMKERQSDRMGLSSHLEGLSAKLADSPPAFCAEFAAIPFFLLVWRQSRTTTTGQ